MVDVLSQKVGVVQRKIKKIPSAEAGLVSRIHNAIKKRRTYDVLFQLEKQNRIKKHLPLYLQYQFHTLEQLEKILEGDKQQLKLFELLLLVHLVHGIQGEKPYDFGKHLQVENSMVPKLPEPEVSNREWLLNLVDDIRTETSTLTLEEFAETVIVPSGQYKGSLYRHDRAPYNRKIHYWMSPESDCSELVNMWGVQIGKSTGVENAAIYYMKVVPSEIMAVLASGEAAQKFSKKRIEPRAAKAGIKFVAEDYGDGKKRSTGNKVLSKEFYGGNFDAVTAGSPSGLASETKRILLKDELDRWPEKVGAEGDPDVVADARADAWGDRAKKINVSSPTLVQTSRIYKKYLEGTQHHFHIPCPICGVESPLEVGMDKDYGLTYELVNGKIKKENVFYICPHCKDDEQYVDEDGEPLRGRWYEKDKLEAMRHGEWVAHATPVRPGLISTQLSSLYSPFKSWIKICTEHKAQVDDPSKEQEFVNMTLGLPYEPKGSRPEISKDNLLRDQTYQKGEVPEGVLFLTAAVDVQRGSKSAEGRKKNPARLEVEVMGVCDRFVTKSIDYLQILGDTDTVGEGAWKELNKLMTEKRFEFYRRRDEMAFHPVIWLLDSSDGDRMDQVYQFCRLRGGTSSRIFPCKGRAAIKRESAGVQGTEDKVAAGDIKPWTKTVLDENLILYQMSTNYYKGKIYSDINSTLNRPDESFPGKVHFPRNYPDKYFEMLTAEEKKPDGTFYCPSGRRNEALDLRVYNLAAMAIYTHLYIQSLKARAKAAKKDAAFISAIGWFTVADILAKQTDQLYIRDDNGDVSRET